MKLIFFLLFLCLGTTIYSQTTKDVINSCLKSLEKNNYDAFRKEYSTLYLQFVKEFEPSYINAVENVQSGNYDQAFIELYNLISEGYMLDEIGNDDNFRDLYTFDEWSNFIEFINSVTANYYNELRKELNKMQYEDQGIRLLLLDLQKSKGANHPTTLMIRKEMKENDSINAIRVQQIIDEFGWLGESQIGSEANQTLFLAIQHVDDLIIQEKYLPILEQAVNDGNAKAWQFAFLTDRVLMNQGRFQVYGTQVIIGTTQQDSYVVPLQNPEKVDELRQQVGLEPLKEYLEEEGLEWDLDKYMDDLSSILEMYNNRNLLLKINDETTDRNI